jgi:hypothetical protein
MATAVLSGHIDTHRPKQDEIEMEAGGLGSEGPGAWCLEERRGGAPTHPQRPRACLSQAPAKHGVCASLPHAHTCSQPLYCLSTRPTSPPYPAPQLISPPSPPPSPDPLACDLQLASASPCPLHGATRPLPTPVEHISAYQGGPAFAPATPQPPPSAAACGTSAPRLPPRGFR